MPIDAAPPTVATVTVQAARLPASPADAAFSIITLDSETIATAPRLDEALTAVPGVQLFRRTSSQAANPTTQGISLRGVAGSGAGRALVTLDGVPQNDPFGGWVIWSGLPNAGIESVQIVRGAGAGPYGAGALTGVIQLAERTQVPAGGEYSLEGAGRGGVSGSAIFATGDIFLVASAQHTDGFTPVRQGAGLADGPLAYRSASAAIRYAPDLGGMRLSLRAGAYQEARDSGLAGAASRSVGASASATLTGGSVGLGTDWRLQAWLRNSDLENSSIAVAPGRNATTPANDQFGTPSLGYGFNAALRGRTWEIGGDLRAGSGETREHFRFLAGAFTRGRVAGGSQMVAGLYAETWRTAGPWLFTGGVRLDRWSDTDGKRLERDLATSAVTLDNHPPDRDGWQPTARAAVRHDLGGETYWRAAAYAGFRPPTLNELHRPFRVGNDVTEANPGLEPEKLYGVEAGLGGADWSLTLFGNRLEGAVTNVTIGFGPGVFPLAGFIPAGGVLRQRQNAGDIDAWGLEGEVRHGWTDGWWRLGGDYTVARVDGGAAAPQLTGLRPAQTPRLTLSADAGWRPAEAIILSGSVRYESSRFDDDLNSRKLSAATTLDLRADWRVSEGATLYAAIDNATDADVETAQTADGISSYDAPRTFRIGLIWRP
jgi:outer membrane receptor protein involved in Fe transport